MATIPLAPHPCQPRRIIQEAREGKIMAIMVHPHTSFSRRRESRVDGRGTSPPFAFTPCHSEHSEESLTSFPRRRESRGEGRGKSWQSLPHHGNHGSKPPPFAFTPCHSEHSEESLTSFPRRRESRGDVTGKSWQSWFKTSPLRKAQGGQGDAPSCPSCTSM